MFTIFLFLGAMAVLVVPLCWLMRDPMRKNSARTFDSATFEESGRRHATYFPVIRRAMASSDFEFLASRAPNGLLLRAHRERQRIAKLYLADLRVDFERLLQLARAIAVLSPQAGASREFVRFRRIVRFWWRYRLVALGLHSGPALITQINGLSLIVAELAAHLESAMKDLGARAATTADSSVDRSHLDMA
jgi:hypothetical protein